MKEVIEFRACVEAIEGGYEFMLAYAAQGRDKESTSTPVRGHLESMSAALGSIGAAVEPQALGPVHQIDLAPTIANILGIKDTDHMQGKTLSLKNKSEH